MKKLQNRRILLGVTGGIAAYKAAELLRQCQTLGAEVRVVMTPAATEFVTPLTFQALSGLPVHTQLLDAEQESGMGHINLARWADVIIVAPASADFIARLASGLANDLLTTVILASDKPLMLAPAMNRVMFDDQNTQDNLRKLEQQGTLILGPDVGIQACGDIGFGRMLEPEALAQDIVDYFQTGELAGVRVLLSAGPTREAIDPVRYISNHSSGKMGFAMAQACVEAGAHVTLVSGPVQLKTPSGVERVDVVSADGMANAVLERANAADIFIATAAVADYTPVDVANNKIKKNKSEIQLNLRKTIDILQTVAGAKKRPFCVGFAAETDNLEAYAIKKLEKKNLDMVAANLVGVSDGGFNSDNNALTVLWSDGRREFERMQKSMLAKKLVTLIAKRFHEKNSI
ncbi:MAG: bifunctional phosphopantothenoylcysteine decarboxylase/phosphopantothenate--cysteine ligase CoaBC [Piscirickettsiaceae bacterium]|nr:MAG: bifunctional phosphopantothenoylcysteine decarboxylase/phosphopantothenate--cysteine ligase CoaBC [Piscirickettsiaceae bacterium]PCI70278.1 MAG: bifunctional phosphopantothenoylcysteine decarboxylase/phosphopantothenate--cysteine ligase CoaBC [Piscirickettsiaceae bacterium]